MILEAITNMISGGGLGVIGGLIGTVISTWSELSKRKSELEILRENNRQTALLAKQDQAHQMALAQQTAAAQERMADIQAAARAVESSSLDFRASHDSDRVTYSAAGAQEKSRLVRWLMGVVDFCRGMIRPGATVYSLVLYTLMLMWVRELINRTQVTMTQTLAERIILEVVFTGTAIITCTVTWWFGVRGVSRKTSAGG
jgi:hypothetical protein